MDVKESDQNKETKMKEQFREMFPTGLMALEMPFIAYSIEKDAVNVVPLYLDKDKVFRHKLDFDS